MLFSKYLDGIWFYSMNMSVIPSYVNDSIGGVLDFLCLLY